MAKRPDVYLELALRALERVPRFLAGRTERGYLADDLCQSAVERQLEVAGDALGQTVGTRLRPRWIAAGRRQFRQHHLAGDAGGACGDAMTA